jgi:Domain of unknown function (DUF6458)
MGFGVSLVLMAAGAILAWAVSADADGVNLNTVGYILLAVGAVGAVLSLVFWSTRASRSRTTYVEDRPGRRGEIVEDDVL